MLAERILPGPLLPHVVEALIDGSLVVLQLDQPASNLAASLGPHEPLAWRAQPGSATLHIFQSYEDVWMVAFGGQPRPIRDLKGLHYYHYLLSRPNRLISALELFTLGRITQVYADLEIQEAALNSGFEGSLGPISDLRAVRGMYERREEVRRQLDAMTLLGRQEAKSPLEEEERELSRRLKASFDRRGRLRVHGAPNERARKAVSGAMDVALTALAKKDDPLAEHLRKVERGQFFRYNDSGIAWEL